MTYKRGNRNQMGLIPQSIEAYVQEEDPVRTYDAFKESLYMEDIDIRDIENSRSTPSFGMVSKIFIDCYSNLCLL